MEGDCDWQRIRRGPRRVKETLQQVIQRFKREHPQASGWEDDEVIEAMLLLLSQEDGSRVSVAGAPKQRHADLPVRPALGRFGRGSVTCSMYMYFLHDRVHR